MVVTHLAYITEAHAHDMAVWRSGYKLKVTTFILCLMLLLTGCVNKEDNYKKELAKLVQSAEAGNTDSMYAIFVFLGMKARREGGYKNGEADLATYWLIKAGEHNDWRAAQVLKLCYEKACFGLPVDLEKSKHYEEVFEKYVPKTLIPK